MYTYSIATYIHTIGVDLNEGNKTKHLQLEPSEIEGIGANMLS